jgi:transcriptional regulator with XRE-family HTH domain
METKKKIGERIRVIRQRLKMSQEKLAQELGVAHNSVSSYETGDAYPSVPGLIKMAEVGNVTLDWLLLGHEVKATDLQHEESRLIKAFRQANREDQQAILRTAENAALVAALLHQKQ